MSECSCTHSSLAWGPQTSRLHPSIKPSHGHRDQVRTSEQRTWASGLPVYLSNLTFCLPSCSVTVSVATSLQACVFFPRTPPSPSAPAGSSFQLSWSSRCLVSPPSSTFPTSNPQDGVDPLSWWLSNVFLSTLALLTLYSNMDLLLSFPSRPESLRAGPRLSPLSPELLPHVWEVVGVR